MRSYMLTPEFDLDLQSLTGHVQLAGNLDLKNKTGTLGAIIDQFMPGEYNRFRRSQENNRVSNIECRLEK